MSVLRLIGMPVIHLQTVIAAQRERIFDLSRSINAHMESAGQTGEHAVGGVTTGLLNLGEEVTWEARHFGIKQRLTVRMTKLESPSSFQDCMVKGAFKSMKHNHIFEDHPDGTLMTDRFEFQSPFGLIGQLFDAVILKNYMRRFLQTRNLILKQMAESDAWRKFIHP